MINIENTKTKYHSFRKKITILTTRVAQTQHTLTSPNNLLSTNEVTKRSNRKTRIMKYTACTTSASYTFGCTRILSISCAYNIEKRNKKKPNDILKRWLPLIYQYGKIN